ncbi:MAG: MBL fold metallo-hydrolase, partial [Alphaproteobacteria bacterium]|nr:MBL fold metallo-hydrolase [Alphaproteobacteria bacterium]
GAQELRHGVFRMPARAMMGADTLAGLSTDVFFDAMAVRLDPAKAAGRAFVLNWTFTDRDETLVQTLRHCTLTHRMGELSAAAAVSVTTTRAALDAIVLGKTAAQAALMSGTLGLAGESARFGELFGMLDQPGGMMFDILTPGEGR